MTDHAQRLRMVTLVFFAIFGLVSCGEGTGPGSEKTIISMTNESKDVYVDDVFEISVSVAEATPVYYAAFNLIYEPGKLEFVHYREGDFLNKKNTAESKLLIRPIVDEPGRLMVGITLLEPSSESSGSGNLLHVSFRAIEKGKTRINFGDEDRGLYNSKQQAVSIEEWKSIEIDVI